MRPRRLPPLLALLLSGCAAPVPPPAAAPPPPVATATGVPRWGLGLDAQWLDALALRPDGSMVALARFSGAVEIGGTRIDTGKRAGSYEPRELIAGLSPSGEVTWARRITDAGAFSIAGAAALPGGETAVVGFGQGIEWLGAKPGKAVDRLIHARFDPAGKLLAARAFDVDIHPVGIVFDPSGVAYVAGTFDKPFELGTTRVAPVPGKRSVFALALGPDGGPRWAQQLGAGGEAIGQIAATRPDGMVLAGTHWRAFEVGGVRVDHQGGADAHVIAFDPAGKPRWARAFGDDKDQHGTRIAVDGRGKVLVGGYVDGRLVLGADTLEGPPKEDTAFLAVLSSAGLPERGKAFSHLAVHGLGGDAAGNVLLEAQARRDADLGIPLEAAERKVESKEDTCLVKLDPTLRPLWGRRFSDGLITGVRLDVDPRGGPVLSGWMKRSFRVGPRDLEHPQPAGQDNAYLAVFDP